jgi:hypothetical protein
MSTRPGIVTSDDLTVAEQADTAARRAGSLGPLIHDCALLPRGWQPHEAARPTARYDRPVTVDDLVRRIRDLGELGDLDN